MERNPSSFVAASIVACLAAAPVSAQHGALRTANVAPGSAHASPLAPFAPRASRAPGARGAGLNILVFDHNTQHQLAQQAAQNIDPTGTVVATATDFNTLLTTQSWDVVAVDCPSNAPSDWNPLANYIAGGGRVVMSFWDWDNDAGWGDAVLWPAFEVTIAQSFSLSGMTLQDSGTTPVFAGVTMPNSDWHNHWGDDGDEFNPTGAALGIGHVGNPSTPAMVLGNAGATIAGPCFDEAGDTWLNDGSGVLLWENLINQVLGGSLFGDVDQISLSTGGQQVLTMNLGPTAGLKTYQMLGSATGAIPGFVYTGTPIPLNPDPYSIYTLLNPNTPPLLNSAGVLDINGKATSVFTLPAGTDPSLAGIVVHHAGITLELIGPNIVVTEATDPAACTLVP